MSLHTIDWTIIVVYFIISISIAWRYKEQAGKSISDFFIGGRNLPWYIAGISMVATTFAADTPLAVTELVGQNGISGNWLWWNMLFGGMLTTFFFAKLWRRAEVLTEVEFIELRYSGIQASLLRGFKSVYLGLFMNCLVIGWVNIALKSILMVFFDLSDQEAFWYVAGAMLFTALYSSISGFMGVAITDVLQFFIAIIGCIILAVIVVNSDKIGGITGLKEKLPGWSMNFFPEISSSSSASDISKTLTISVGAFLAYLSIWWTSWYPGAEPGGGGYVAQRMMSTKTEKDSVYATLFFQIAHYCLRPWPWIIVGLCALVLYPELSYADKKLGYVMAMKEFLPVGLKGLLLVSFLAAYMSTISTQLNWGTSYIVNDLYKRFIRKESCFQSKEVAEKHYVLTSKFSTILIMIIALAVTTQIQTISGVWSFIIECGAGLGLVLILRWYWWRINAWSEITATIAPFIGYGCSNYLFELRFPNSFFITVGFTTLSWIVVTYLTKPTDERVISNFYLKVRPAGSWKPVLEKLDIEKNSTSITTLTLCWLSAVGMVYSILFATGKLIFMEWNAFLLWTVLAIVFFLLLKQFISKSKLFE